MWIHSTDMHWMLTMPSSDRWEIQDSLQVMGLAFCQWPNVNNTNSAKHCAHTDLVAIWGSDSPNLWWPTHNGIHSSTLMPRYLERSSLLKTHALVMNARSRHKLSGRALQLIYKNNHTHISQGQQSHDSETFPPACQVVQMAGETWKRAVVGLVRINHVF